MTTTTTTPALNTLVTKDTGKTVWRVVQVLPAWLGGEDAVVLVKATSKTVSKKGNVPVGVSRLHLVEPVVEAEEPRRFGLTAAQEEAARMGAAAR